MTCGDAHVQVPSSFYDMCPLWGVAVRIWQYERTLMTYPVADSPRQNRLLGKLPISEYARIANEFELVELTTGQVLYELGKSLDHVYFPINCTASLISTTEDGEMSELAMTGYEGFVGIPLVLGGERMNHRVAVSCAGYAWRLPAGVFQASLAQSAGLQKLVLCYVQALMTQMAQSIVCGQHHSVMERLCCWILSSSDAVRGDELMVTHELVAHMLGVRRESITQAAGRLQSKGWISTSRGKLKINDRNGLCSVVCECYGLVKAESQRLLDRLVLPQEGSGDGHGDPMTRTSAASASAVTSEDGRISAISGHETVGGHGSSDLASDEVRLLQKYVDVYDFAPVGLVTLDVYGKIAETNLAGAILLGVQRSRSQACAFADFLDDASRQAFMTFHAEVLDGKCRRHCEVILPATDHREWTVVRLHATVDEEGDEIRMVLVDVTEERKILADAVAREREHFAGQDASLMTRSLPGETDNRMPMMDGFA
jgi:CRP-like cAMP-binding protein